MKKFLFVPLAWLLPLGIAFAQIETSGGLRTGYAGIISLINNYLLPLIFAIGFIMFLFGLVKYVASGGEEDARKEARSTMIWGILILAMMIAAWGFVKLLANTFFDSNAISAPSDLPTV